MVKNINKCRGAFGISFIKKLQQYRMNRVDVMGIEEKNEKKSEQAKMLLILRSFQLKSEST